MARHAARAHRRAQRRAWPAAWPSTAWPTAGCCARGPSTNLDPARGRRRRRRARRGALRLAPDRCGNPRAVDGAPRRHARRATSGRSSPTTRSAAWLDEPRLPVPSAARGSAARARRIAELIADGEVVGLFAGAHGVRSAGPRAPLDHRRPALAQDAVDHEPQDQVPRVLPAVRPGGARRAGEPTTSTSTARVALHAAGGRRARTSCASRRRRARRTTTCASWVNQARSDIPAVTHVDYSARIQTVDARDEPRVPRHPRAPSSSSPAARCSSTPPSTCAASRSSAPPRTPTAASCAPRWTTWSSESCLLDKKAQPEWTEDARWQQDYVLD